MDTHIKKEREREREREKKEKKKERETSMLPFDSIDPVNNDFFCIFDLTPQNEFFHCFKMFSVVLKNFHFGLKTKQNLSSERRT
jgi:hypothetical protein